MGGVGGGSPYHRCYRQHDEEDHDHDDHDEDDHGEDDHGEDDHDEDDDAGGYDYDGQGPNSLSCIVQVIVGKMMIIGTYKEHK